MARWPFARDSGRVARSRVLEEHEPGHGIEFERLRSAFRGGSRGVSGRSRTLILGETEAWWAQSAAASRAPSRMWASSGERRATRRRIRERYTDAAIGWELFDDTLPALAAVRAGGWRSAVLSNHVPELDSLVDGLGLGEHLDAVSTRRGSAMKSRTPRRFASPERFRVATAERGWSATTRRQTSREALGAGMRAILVRHDGGGGLLDAAAAILGSKTP